jgi:ABC-type dipeptide/oligopeptide/nickel transport system permease subunit
VLVVRQLEFVQAIRSLGGSDMRVMWRHVLPNVVAPVVISATLGIAGAIMAEAALSFLGLGVPPPTPSWGSMIADGRDLNQLRTAPWTSLFPGMAIGAAVLGFNLLGDALRDILDPRFAPVDANALPVAVALGSGSRPEGPAARPPHESIGPGRATPLPRPG